MRSVKTTNQQVRAAYPANKNPKQEPIQLPGNKNKSTKSLKNIKSNRNKGKESANTSQHETDETFQTGMVNRHNRDPLDDKSTIRKKSFDSKPIIKDLVKRINKFSKQYTPEYFAQILEFTIEKQMKNSLAITADKITKYRKFISDKRKVETQVRREMNKVKEVIETNRKRFAQQNNKQKKIPKIHFCDDDSESETKGNSQGNFFNSGQNEQKQEQQIYSQHYEEYELYSEERLRSSNGSSRRQREKEISTLSQESSPGSAFSSVEQEIQVLTESNLQREWSTKYDQYVCLIDTIYALLGQNECKNSIFPACYLFFSLLVSDQKTFSVLENKYLQQIGPTSNNHHSNNNASANRSILSKASPKQMIQYYIIVSLLISTKYHDIYPVSAEQLIQSLNFNLSMEKVMKIQCDVLEMYDFCQYFDENQQKFLRMFIVVVGWKQQEQNICQFILQSGLSNPKLFKYSPLFKAAAVIGFYEQKIMKNQEKFMLVKNLCPGLTVPLANEIKKLYSEIIIYHHRNKFTETIKKYYIFDNELKRLSKK